MARVFDVVQAMADFAPVDLAAEWDNVGLLLGDEHQEVSKIIVMLDLDEKGVTEAMDVGADLIITHHPLIMCKLSNITDPLFLRLIENKISVCSMHTNLDSADEGVNQVLAESLGLTDIHPLQLEGINARAGYIETCTFGDFIIKVKQCLDIDCLRYVGDKNTWVNKVCVLGGSGGDFAEDVKSSGADAFVTADLKYHKAQLAEKIGLCVIDAGHFETENPVIFKVARYLREVFPDIDVITSRRTKSYIKYE